VEQIMSTSTHALSGTGALAGAGAKSAAFFRRAFQRFIEGQERRAAHVVRRYLAGLTDAHLTQLGYSPAAIKQLRTHDDGLGTAWL